MEQHIYTGFHAVEEQVRRAAERRTPVAMQLYYSKIGPRIKKILALAGGAGISARQVAEAELDAICAALPPSAQDHRGLVLSVQGKAEPSGSLVQLERWLGRVPQNATVLMLDAITDPHNIGAIMRSCDQFGVDLLVAGASRTTGNLTQNETIARTSAGASAWVPVAVVPNLVRAALQLKQAGFWLYGADSGGASLAQVSFAPLSCIVVGSEGNGIARLLGEQCDTIVSIPTCGKIDSLNVSVATGILLYERSKSLCRK